MAYTPTVWVKGDKVTSARLNKIENGIADKVDKVNGKVLSTNDYTNGDKKKVDDISISSPTNGQALVYNSSTQKWENKTISGGSGQDGYSPTITVTNITGGHRVSITDATGTQTFDVMDGTSSGGSSGDAFTQWNGKTWYAYGTSITNIASEGRYATYLEQMSGMTLVNKGISGGGIGDFVVHDTGIGDWNGLGSTKGIADGCVIDTNPAVISGINHNIAGDADGARGIHHAGHRNQCLVIAG